MTSLPVRWRPRAVPLTACGVIARGEAARALGRQLARWSDLRLAAVRGCAGGDALVLLGEESALPWIDGASYLGRDPGVPGWLVPTSVAPDAPMPIFAEALARRLPSAGAWAIARGDEGLIAVALAAVAPISRERLQLWVARP